MGFLSNIKRRLRVREDHEKLLIVDGKYIVFEKFTLFQRLLHVAALRPSSGRFSRDFP